jgi:tyrosine-protein kinase Etk/Wzc
VTNASLPESSRNPAAPSMTSGEVGGKESNEMSILDVLVDLLRRKHIVFAFTMCFCLFGIAVSFLLPAQFTATVTLLPPQQNSSLASVLASQGGMGMGMASLAGGALGLRSPNDMYVAMLKSRTVEDAMVKQFGLMSEYHRRFLSDARKALESHATIDGSGKDGLIHVSIEDSNPTRAAELTNGYVNQFQKLTGHLAITEAAQRRLFFQQQLEQAKDDLATAEESLKSTEQETGMIQIDSQTRGLIETAASLRAQITAKEVQIQSMQIFATNENSEILQAQEELNALRKQLAKLGDSERSSDPTLIVPKGKLASASLEYVRKVREVKYSETVFDILARQLEIAKLDEAKQGAVIQIVDSAVPPDKRSSPRRSLIVILFTGTGLLVGVLFALSQSWFERIKQEPELSQKINRVRESLALSGARRN